MNYWTQKVPTKSGYYWFALNYQDTPLCLYFEADWGDKVVTYGYFYNDPLYVTEDDKYYFSAYPIESLDWSNE